MTVYIVLLCLCASWLVPLHFPPWVSWHSEVLAFLAVLLLAWLGVVGATKKDSAPAISFPFSTAILFGLIVLIWIQASAGVITFGGDALVRTLYLFGCIACIVIGQACRDDRRAYVLLAGTVLMAAILSVVVACAQVFDLWEGSAWISRMPQVHRPGGNMGQPNQLATLLLMGIASLLFLYESKRLGHLASMLLGAILLSGMAMTESRTSLLSLTILTFWWVAKRKSLAFRLSPWIVLGAVGGFLCLFWAWPWLLDALLQTTGTGSTVNISVGTRWQVWPQLLEAVLQRPWWGWGLGQVSTALNAVVHAYAISEPFTYAHNILLDLAVGVGIPFTTLAAALGVIWLWRRIRSANKLAPWYCLALVLPVAVHSMLEFPFAYAYFLFPVMFAVGALGSASGAKPAFSLGVKPVMGVLMVTTAVLMWSVIEYLEIEEDFRVVRFEALRIGTTPQDYQRPQVLLLTQLDALLIGGRIVPKPGMTSDELDLARKVALRFPWPATQNRYALSLALNGNPAEAVRQLQVMRALHGAQAYEQIRANWSGLAAEKYPQLRDLPVPQ